MGSSLTLKPSEVKTFDEIKTLVEEYSEESKEILEDVERVEELPVEKYSEESREASEYYERFEQLLETLTELKEIKADCSQPNWEGEDELPITEATEAKARKLLFLAARLPNLIELPTVTPTASGYIELEWYKEKGHRFVVRLNGHGRFIYAGLFGTDIDDAGQKVENNGHGTGTFLNNVLPNDIKSGLFRLYNIQND